MKAENALLEKKKLDYKSDIASFETLRGQLLADTNKLKFENAELRTLSEFGAFLDKLRAERSVESVSIDDLVGVFSGQDERGRNRIEFAKTILRAEPDITVKSLLLYALYLGTHHRPWRDELCEVLNKTAFAGTDDVFRAVAEIFGDKRWPDADRPDVAATVMQRIDEMDNARQLVGLQQIGKLHIGTMFGYPDYQFRPTTHFRLDSANATLFLKAVIIARTHALSASSEAFVALSQFAPPAMLAVTASLMSLIERDGLIPRLNAERLQSCVDFANKNTRYGLQAPTVLDGREIGRSLGMPEIRHSVFPAWKIWRDAHARFVAVWSEPNLDTLRGDNKVYLSMFSYKYGGYEADW